MIDKKTIQNKTKNVFNIVLILFKKGVLCVANGKTAVIQMDIYHTLNNFT